jgi:hypothetical protein
MPKQSKREIILKTVVEHNITHVQKNISQEQSHQIEGDSITREEQ